MFTHKNQVGPKKLILLHQSFRNPKTNVGNSNNESILESLQLKYKFWLGSLHNFAYFLVWWRWHEMSAENDDVTWTHQTLTCVIGKNQIKFIDVSEGIVAKTNHLCASYFNIEFEIEPTNLKKTSSLFSSKTKQLRQNRSGRVCALDNRIYVDCDLNLPQNIKW